MEIKKSLDLTNHWWAELHFCIIRIHDGSIFVVFVGAPTPPLIFILEKKQILKEFVFLLKLTTTHPRNNIPSNKQKTINLWKNGLFEFKSFHSYCISILVFVFNCTLKYISAYLNARSTLNQLWICFKIITIFFSYRCTTSNANK